MQVLTSADANNALFDRLSWRDPLSGLPLEPIVSARAPSGVPICGALRVAGTDTGYPIVDCIARVTPELAQRYAEWLKPFGLKPAGSSTTEDFQAEGTVDSFGFQWTWNAAMRSEEDLRWRVASRFKLSAADFAGKLVLDAGSGAGDQSRWLLDQDAEVVSIDLSSAIEVVARKLRLRPGWVGVQGDVTMLPFADGLFGLSYCEGVIQHTRDSARTVRELHRVLKPGGLILATHYGKATKLLGKLRSANIDALRKSLSRLDRYKLLWITGNIAALSYVPLLGKLLRLTGTAIYSDLMPDYKTTWTNTFDTYGNHAYQRHITPEEFWQYFRDAGNLERVFSEGTVVLARKAAVVANR